MTKGTKIEINGKEVRYLVETDWERKALLANGFYQCESEDHIMHSHNEGAEYIANTIKSGGIG